MELPIVKILRNCLVPVLLFFLLSACNPRMGDLSEREAEINARESELVTLFAELLEQKKALKNHQENAASSKPTECSSDSKSDFTTTANTQKEKTSLSYTKTVSGGVEKIHLPPDSRTLLGRIEKVYLDPPGMEFNARIDTGAQTSSLNAIDIVEFERDGKPHVRFNIINPKTGEKTEIIRRLRRYARVKELNNRESQNRPVVRMRVVIADIDEQINFTLVDRSKLKHQVLIGRNLLRDLAIVDVSKKYTTVRNDKVKQGDLR
ncbi:MAG: ATP-dependent zinc protease [Nitrosomonas sp.]|nr:ATP-dependent zinc protease [Nitrosomonas sp.]